MLPKRQPGQSFFPKYAFALGKAYANFYKTGAKAIYANFKACRPIQAELDTKYDGSLSRAIEDGSIDRNKFQLLTRSWFDVKRVPIFALVFALCGEFTPVVVIAMPAMVPYVCRIPRQIEGDRKKVEARRSRSFRNLTTDLPAQGQGVKDLQRMQLLHISWSLGLSSSAWDWLGGRLPGLPTMILRRKVARTVHHLELDDKLIKRHGRVREMNLEEVRIALGERGVDVLGIGEQQLRSLLSSWVESRDVASVERLLLTRPSVWPSQKHK
ncbi:MAG: hypothetical protein M1818_000660 [Claussenomyces sp. TS43310]|nr:MAG: hypothetical protein M1818_000660 [Claussenomyces sp. TS43310]